MSNNWMRRTLSILIVLLFLCSSLPIGLSPIKTAKADAYDYDVYMHPDDLAETFYTTGSPAYAEGWETLTFDNRFTYQGKYIFAVGRESEFESVDIIVNGVNKTYFAKKYINAEISIYFYLLDYSSSYEIDVYYPMLWWETSNYEVKSYLITDYIAPRFLDREYAFFAPFYPRYSEYNFMGSIYLQYPANIDIAGSDYIGSNVASNVSTRTIDDVGFHGAVYTVIMKNKMGSYPNTDGVRVSTDLWGPATMYYSSQFIVGNEYYKLQLYRLGYIDTNPLSTSKDIELTITDSNPSTSEHLLIAKYDPQQSGYTDYYTYYYGYTDSVKTDYLICAYTSNDYYANLKVHVYDSDTGQAVSDALVELDGETTTWQITDSLGDTFYDNIVYGITRSVRVTHPNYPDWSGSIYIDAGYNTLNVPLGAVTVGPETTVYTDKTLYDRYETVTFTYNIADADWSAGDIYDIEILKGTSILGLTYWSWYDNIAITQSQSSSATWTPEESGLYMARLRRNTGYWKVIANSNQFSVAETTITPTGNLTLDKSSFNISETITLNVTDMNMEGKVVIREKGFYPEVKSIYIPESGLYNITMDYAGIFTAQLEVVHLGKLVVLDIEEFTVKEDKDFAYITIRNVGLELAKGETLYFWAYSPETADVTIYNPNDTIVMSKQPLEAGVLGDFEYQLPANAIEGVYIIKMTNATDVELTNATFRVVGDIYNWIQWDKSTYWLTDDSVITSFSYSNIFEGIKIQVYKMEQTADGEWVVAYNQNVIYELIYEEPKPSGQEVIPIGVEGRYRVCMWEYKPLLFGWGITGAPYISEMEVRVPEPGQIIDGEPYVPTEPIEGEGLFALYPIFKPWEDIFGKTIGKGMFAIMTITVVDLTLAGAGIAMSVIGLMSILMTLIFVWVGILPLFVGILLVILGSIQIVKMYTGGR